MSEQQTSEQVAGDEPTCPICGADLYLVTSTSYAIGRVGITSVSSGWEVFCSEDHKVWTEVDQIRYYNAVGLTDEGDEAADYAPPFRLVPLLGQLGRLRAGGESGE